MRKQEWEREKEGVCIYIYVFVLELVCVWERVGVKESTIKCKCLSFWVCRSERECECMREGENERESEKGDIFCSRFRPVIMETLLFHQIIGL